MKDQKLIRAIERLIDAGCNYRIDELKEIYAPDLVIHILQEDSSLMTFDYEKNLDFFRSLRDSDAPPLDSTAHFNLAEVQNDIGFVVVTRTMNLGAGPKKIVFNLMLREGTEGWQVFREQAVIAGEA
ncbi:MAG: nuclear transport factor 2 family protein [Betaproteobacteria bacterium]|nr:nuclear transport factor 2 family protein [Betaproteobacteria bacterium]